MTLIPSFLALVAPVNEEKYIFKLIQNLYSADHAWAIDLDLVYEKSEVLISETLCTRHVEYVKVMTLKPSFPTLVADVNEEE